MPAGYTHYCFGEEMKKVYSPHLQKIIQDNIELYEIGLKIYYVEMKIVF